jgi:hypothetical protein
MPRLVFLLLLSCAVCTFDPAHAAVDPAELLIREGVELRRKGRDAEALERFQRAYDLSHSPRAAAQLGLCEQVLRQWVEADAHLTEGLTSSHPWIERNRGTLERSVKTVRAQLATILVKGAPAGAVVTVNGSMVGRLPNPVPTRVLPGTAVIVATSAGYNEERIERPLRAGETVTVTLDLTAVSNDIPPAIAATPPHEPLPAPITLDTSARQPVEGEWMRPAAYVSWGLSAVALGFGIFSHIQRESAASDFATEDLGCDKLNGIVVGGVPCEDAANRFDGAQSRLVIGYAAAGMFAVTGVVLWLLDRKSSDGKALSFTCAPAAAGAICQAPF